MATKGAGHAGYTVWPSQILVPIYPSSLWVTHYPLPRPIFGLSTVAELVTLFSVRTRISWAAVAG